MFLGSFSPDEKASRFKNPLSLSSQCNSRDDFSLSANGDVLSPKECRCKNILTKVSNLSERQLLKLLVVHLLTDEV